MWNCMCAAWTIFQSTPPVKAATLLIFYLQSFSVFQSTPPVKAATIQKLTDWACCQISIHAAREGGDAIVHTDKTCNDKFQSTPPVKAATKRQYQRAKVSKFQSTPPVKAATCSEKIYFRLNPISIHAAREGGDINPPLCRQK